MTKVSAPGPPKSRSSAIVVATVRETAEVSKTNEAAEIAAKFPGYGFENHVGYGTPEHRASLKLQGVSAIHRITYKPIADLIQLPA